MKKRNPIARVVKKLRPKIVPDKKRKKISKQLKKLLKEYE